MEQPLKMLRYNTGTDKKAFSHLKKTFDAAIFNATIVAYSGASVADLISMHSQKYIIDPQTHIFKQERLALSSAPKKPELPIKKSIEKYLDQLPETLSHIRRSQTQSLNPSDIANHLGDLVKRVYSFETEFVEQFIEKKEYDKYLKFAGIVPEPKLIVAPYFMLKAMQPHQEQLDWLHLNRASLEKTIELNQSLGGTRPIAGQLVLEKQVLLGGKSFLADVKNTYDVPGYDYIFVWIDDFNSFEAKQDVNVAFSELIKTLNNIGKKPLMAYGGYESIMLCARDSDCKLFGVAQSVGYGEYRSITPVGGGVPVNKYYFPPLHQRLKLDEVTRILRDKGYFDDLQDNQERVEKFYAHICGCKVCKKVIDNDINNFIRFNESIPFTVKTKNGPLERNRATNDALLIAAIHFLYCKADEWNNVSTQSFAALKKDLLDAFSTYMPSKLANIEVWCQVYGN